MIVVDSFGWLEYFTAGKLSEEYYKFLKKPDEVVTPAVVIYEVYKKIKNERGEEEALSAVAQMKKTVVVPLTEAVALTAADLSIKHALPMADAMVCATARLHNCKVVTSDPHFKGLSDAVFLERK